MYVILAATGAMDAMDREALRHKVVGKGAVAGSVAKAGVGTLRNSPGQWGRSPQGIAMRVGSNLGQHAVKEAIQTGVAAALHENLHYQPSNLNGHGRVWNMP